MAAGAEIFDIIFGSKPSSDAELAALSSIQADFAGLLIYPAPADFPRAFESWTWLNVPRDAPLIVSAFGDAVFAHSGSLVILDTLTGELTRVSRTIQEFREKLNQKDFQDQMLSSVWVQAARMRGILLEHGECYDWMLPPALGGKMLPENIQKMNFVVKVNIAGQLHQQIKDLPPGTKINRVTISEWPN